LPYNTNIILFVEERTNHTTTPFLSKKILFFFGLFPGLYAPSKERAMLHFSQQYLYNSMSDSTFRQLIVVGV
jgi:hypothetical protein